MTRARTYVSDLSTVRPVIKRELSDHFDVPHPVSQVIGCRSRDDVSYRVLRA
jgi:hypothetical protein